MKHNLLLIISNLIRILLFFLPESTLFSKFRGFLYSLFLANCGKNFQVSSDVRLINLENLQVGNDVYIAPGCILNAIDKILIGDGVMLGFNVVVVSGDHTLIEESYRYGKSLIGPIFIDSGAWIGANSTIVKNSHISKGVLIGANSLVRGITKPFKKYAGVPIKEI
jgi:maltose O-acetyltransferase